jgi:hypothetical protein
MRPYRSMTTRRGRATHVRPRPPSSGRSPQSVRTAKPDPHRVRQHRGIDARRNRLPLATRVLLALSILTLGGAVYLTATGGIGPVVSALAASVSSAFSRLSATPLPSESLIVATSSPIISQPASPYSRDKTVTLQVTVPQDVAGTPNAKVRLYLALKGLKAAPIQDEPITSASTLFVPVDLTKGRNDLSATIIRDGVESAPSAVVTITLDQVPPKIVIKSPKAGTSLTDPNVTIKGTTEAGTTLIARNAANGASASTTAGTDGAFQVILPLAPGPNAIHFAATDLAGNKGAANVSYLVGTGQMGANLYSSIYRISVSKHPRSLQLTVFVTDPTGAPLSGADAFFTLQIPGLAPISGQVVTGSDGKAVFTTPLIGSMGTGGGAATVLVTQALFGQATDRVALTFIP